MLFIMNETIYKSEKIGNFESVFSAVISPVHSAVKVAKIQKWSELWKAAVAAQSLLKNLQLSTKSYICCR